MSSVKVLQYGEGNFMRCFAEDLLQRAKNAGVFDGSVALVAPRSGAHIDVFKRQNCRYTIILRGIRDGKPSEEVLPVDVVSEAVHPASEYESYRALTLIPDLKVVLSNTTEAGIVFDPADRFDGGMECSFPAKITKMLYDRFTVLGERSGLLFLPCELIPDNGGALRKCVVRYAEIWNLGSEFIKYVNEQNTFCSTLVDRIVTGFPKGDPALFYALAGWEDKLITVGEPYFLWVIEGDRTLTQNYPWLDAPGVVITDRLDLYRERKVKVLNGLHTAGVPLGLLGGVATVGEGTKTPYLRAFWERCAREEILPTISLHESEKSAYLASVFERFENPFVDHAFRSIALNSVSKWKSRLLPTLCDSIRMYHKIPIRLTFSLAALLALYFEHPDSIDDDPSVKAFFAAAKEETVLHAALSDASWWGEDLTKTESLAEAVQKDFAAIRALGIQKAVEAL